MWILCRCTHTCYLTVKIVKVIMYTRSTAGWKRCSKRESRLHEPTHTAAAITQCAVIGAARSLRHLSRSWIFTFAVCRATVASMLNVFVVRRERHCECLHEENSRDEGKKWKTRATFFCETFFLLCGEFIFLFCEHYVSEFWLSASYINSIVHFAFPRSPSRIHLAMKIYTICARTKNGRAREREGEMQIRAVEFQTRNAMKCARRANFLRV